MIWPLQPIFEVRPFLGLHGAPLVFLWPVPVYEHVIGMARISLYFGAWKTGVEFHYQTI